MPESSSGGSAAPGREQLSSGAATARRGLGHRADSRDTVAELAEKAQLISQEAGSKVAAAMKDVISAAAGIAGFAVESARDLTTYMVRRGQMTQVEADKLLREAEAAHARRPAAERRKPTATKIAADKAALAKAQAARAAEIAAAAFAKLHPPRPSRPASKVFMPKPARAAAKPARPATRKAGKTAARAGAQKNSRPAGKGRAGKPKGRATGKPVARTPANRRGSRRTGKKR